jgi:hypothetical protein
MLSIIGDSAWGAHAVSLAVLQRKDDGEAMPERSEGGKDKGVPLLAMAPFRYRGEAGR